MRRCSTRASKFISVQLPSMREPHGSLRGCLILEPAVSYNTQKSSALLRDLMDVKEASWPIGDFESSLHQLSFSAGIDHGILTQGKNRKLLCNNLPVYTHFPVKGAFE